MKLIFLIALSLLFDASRGIGRNDVIARARNWEARRIPYSMAAYTREPNGPRNYRTDCSGYVSMAWGLSNSLSTVTLPGISHRIRKDDLQAGDILLKGGPGSAGAAGHVVIFHTWADGGRTHYFGYEQTDPHTLYRKIRYPYSSGNYEPYRYNHISNDGAPPLQPPQPSSPSTGGGCICSSSGRALGEYCGHQLGSGCEQQHIYGCNAKGRPVSKHYGNCKKGCQAIGDGQSKCIK